MGVPHVSLNRFRLPLIKNKKSSTTRDIFLINDFIHSTWKRPFFTAYTLGKIEEKIWVLF